MKCSAYKLKDMMKCERFLPIISRIMLYACAIALICVLGGCMFVLLGGDTLFTGAGLILLACHFAITVWCLMLLLAVSIIMTVYVIFRNVSAGKSTKKAKKNWILIIKTLCLVLLALFYYWSTVPSSPSAYGFISTISWPSIILSLTLACFVLMLSDNAYVDELDDRKTYDGT